jgi:ATP synthase I subunit
MADAQPLSFERNLVRRTALLGALCATGLGALGRFTSALALTLGTAVAIVSALWLSDVVSRLAAPKRGVAARFDWKFCLKGVLRYLVMGAALFGAVRLVPGDVPWLLAGVSTVVAVLGIEAIAEVRRASRGEKSAA